MSLAEILVDMPVRSAYIATLIFAGAQVLTTLAVVALQSRPAQWLRSVREHGALIARRCRTLIRVSAILLWAGVSLNVFGVLGAVASAGLSLLQWRWRLGAAEISIQDLAVFFAVFLSAVIFSRMLRFVLTEEIIPALSFASWCARSRGCPLPLRRAAAGVSDRLGRGGCRL